MFYLKPWKGIISIAAGETCGYSEGLINPKGVERWGDKIETYAQESEKRGVKRVKNYPYPPKDMKCFLGYFPISRRDSRSLIRR